MGRKEKVQEIRGKDTRELNYDLEQLRKDLFHARLQVPTDTGRSSDIRGIKRQIARILTILKQREVELAGEVKDAKE
ncbi:MAG TPA: 50S ribosomal protein L29 [Planctomycetes bacterium]|nr:50S ribosomal protein L29 [Planctomycetota bacterium]